MSAKAAVVRNGMQLVRKGSYWVFLSGFRVPPGSISICFRSSEESVLGLALFFRKVRQYFDSISLQTSLFGSSPASSSLNERSFSSSPR
jgi:hypothetical protein